MLKEKIPQGRWKSLVKRAVLQANEMDIRSSAEQYKKIMNKIADDEKFGCKEYIANLPLSQARTLFEHKYSMSKYVKMNYKGDPAFEKSLWKCQ